MNEAREILKRNIVGCTTNNKGQVTRIWFYGNEQFYLDTKARTIKAEYDTREYLGISENATKVAIRRAKEWKNACSSE